MAGHSKFKNIQFRKGAQDKKRAKQFSKIGREIQIAVKIAGTDIESNPRLRLAITKARSVNMPKDNVDRAINKNNSDTTEYSEVRYEGYGPFGTAFIVEALTDNKNRTASEIRSIFSKNGGNLGETGSVSFNFDKVGEIQIKSEINDTLLEELLEQGLEDYSIEDNNTNIYCKFESLASLEKVIMEKGLDVQSALIVWKPNMTVKIEKEDELNRLIKLNDDLEDNDDVQNCFSNLDFDSSLLDDSNA
ncbi:YebC/PmpR family DNA-binding transcriptional regulator [Alphaproteobacteria bacterium]|nr:YebC/PmpR family DNA-binding transcriptional regulator [Alphaproteobacteria bacterium]